jgi:hypothetical protein
MTAKPYFASVPLAGAEAGDAAAPTASAGPFVLNLCSSSTPMSTPPALTQTDLLTFFVSRRFTSNRPGERVPVAESPGPSRLLLGAAAGCDAAQPAATGHFLPVLCVLSI